MKDNKNTAQSPEAGTAKNEKNTSGSAEIKNADKLMNDQIAQALQKPETVEEKILKVAILQQRISERSALIKHKERLAAFKLSDFQEKDSLVIVTAAGDEYAIKSSKLVKEVLDLMNHKIATKVLEVEAEINFN